MKKQVRILLAAAVLALIVGGFSLKQQNDALARQLAQVAP